MNEETEVITIEDQDGNQKNLSILSELDIYNPEKEESHHILLVEDDGDYLALEVVGDELLSVEDQELLDTINELFVESEDYEEENRSEEDEKTI